MSPHALFDSYLAPVEMPSEPHACESDVVSYRSTENGLVVQEVYRRPNGFLVFRYFAWVAWRDAGNIARSHAWHGISPDEALVTDEYRTACEVAERHAASKGLRFASWSTP